MAQDSGTPKVSVNVQKNNLQRQILVLDGVPGIVATSATKIGEFERVFSLADAVEKGYTLEDEPFLYGIIEQFYNEIGGSFELAILGVEDTMTMAQMCTNTNLNGARKLLLSGAGAINLIGIARKPSQAYNPGNDFLDVDVVNALTTSRVLAEYQQSINRPVRFLIEGRVANLEDDTIFQPKTASNGYAGVVLGNDVSDGSAGIGSALARACKFAAHVKIGNGQNGPLAITQAFIGDKAIEDFYPEELDAFTNAGYIIAHKREGAAGYYYSVDKMASTDDYSILVHGRIIDKAQRILTAATTPFLETDIRINPDGSINATDAKYLENVCLQQLQSSMSEQVSGFAVSINTNQDVISTSKINIQGAVQPLGYTSYIIFDLGLTKTL